MSWSCNVACFPEELTFAQEPLLTGMHAQDRGHRSNSAFVPWDNYTEVSAPSQAAS